MSPHSPPMLSSLLGEGVDENTSYKESNLTFLVFHPSYVTEAITWDARYEPATFSSPSDRDPGILIQGLIVTPLTDTTLLCSKFMATSFSALWWFCFLLSNINSKIFWELVPEPALFLFSRKSLLLFIYSRLLPEEPKGLGKSSRHLRPCLHFSNSELFHFPKQLLFPQ